MNIIYKLKVECPLCLTHNKHKLSCTLSANMKYKIRIAVFAPFMTLFYGKIPAVKYPIPGRHYFDHSTPYCSNGKVTHLK